MLSLDPPMVFGGNHVMLPPMEVHDEGPVDPPERRCRLRRPRPRSGTLGVWIWEDSPYKCASSSSAGPSEEVEGERRRVMGVGLVEWVFVPASSVVEDAVGLGRDGRRLHRRSNVGPWGQVVYSLVEANLFLEPLVLKRSVMDGPSGCSEIATRALDMFLPERGLHGRRVLA